MEQNMMLFDMQLSVIREGNLAIREENSVNDTTQEFRQDCEPRAISISRIQPIRGFIGYPIKRCKELLYIYIYILMMHKKSFVNQWSKWRALEELQR